MELISGNLYFINANLDSPIFNSYDVVTLIDVMEEEPKALVQLYEPFSPSEHETDFKGYVLVSSSNLTPYTEKSVLPEPEPEPEPIIPEVIPTPEPEPVLPNVD